MHSKLIRVKVGFRGYQKYDLVVYRRETFNHFCENYHFFLSLVLLNLFKTITCLQFFISSMVNVVFNTTKDEMEKLCNYADNQRPSIHSQKLTFYVAL